MSLTNSNMTSSPNHTPTNNALPLPVILLADVSGSMCAEGKIHALNQSVRDMLADFASADDIRAEIRVAVVTFGGTARLVSPLMPAKTVVWEDVCASGSTPMGEALAIAASLVENWPEAPASGYKPTLLLVSDGIPTDSWRTSLERLNQQSPVAQADRMALAIGADADVDMLREFLGSPDKPLFIAADACRIKDFFRYFTLSVTSRAQSVNPNVVSETGAPEHLEMEHSRLPVSSL